MNFGGIFDVDRLKWRLEELDLLLASPDLWDNPEKSKILKQEQTLLQNKINPFYEVKEALNNLQAAYEMALDDPTWLDEIENDINLVAKNIKDIEFKRMFTHKFDPNNAFIEIQSGSGGTEAQDWAQMLMRMYRRYCERKGFQVEILDWADGDVAGIKGVYLKIEGPYAYGMLRTESGVHRLVRKSPFDSGNRRHTSFAAVFVTPEIEDDIDIVINPSDLRIDTYRASGAGGQHVNRTDSAIRITHLPTGIVVQCQSDRSQHKNRSTAMNQLKAKLYDLEQQKKQQEQAQLESSKTEITWGAQVRSYVLDDSRVKDLRTSYETTNTTAMLNGDLLDDFITASLLKGC